MKLKNKKKPVKEGLRNISQNFVKEKELEENIRNEIAKEIDSGKRKANG